MWDERLEERWRQLCTEAITGMAEWRQQHPKATLSEMEAAFGPAPRQRACADARGCSNGQPGHDLRTTPPVERPLCPQCGARLQHRTWRSAA